MKNMIQRFIILIIASLTALSAKAQGATTLEGGNDYANTGYEVGEIPIQYALTPTGAVTYQVAIDIHPDPEDFHPRLSFCYNSQQRESALGYGWNISGLSGITHVAGTIYYDGKSSPLSLNEDKLMLDGIRLLKTGTNSWQSEQGFVKVKKLANGSLQARYPDGNIALFEAFAQAPFSYVMTSYTNRKGRTIKYDYTQVDNLPYIRKILYGEAGSVYNDSIVFTYRNVTDDITRYVDGKAFKYSRLLEKVESFYKSTLWRRYLLSYQNRGVDLPVQLDCETESGKLTPLRFKYGDGRSIEFLSGRTIYLQKYFPNSVQGANSHRSLALSRGKFSRASKSDGLISYPVLGEYKEDQHLLVYKDLSTSPVSPVIFTAGKGFKQLEAVDVNGDGLEEPVKVNYDEDRLMVSVYTNNVDPNRHSDYVYSEWDGYVHERQVLTGDFNGDGKAELLAISTCYDSNRKKYPSRALLVDLNSRKAIYNGTCFDFALYQADSRALHADRLIPMDYNGDGKTDICLININGLYVYEFTGDGFRQLAYSSAINIMHFNFESGTIKDRELMVADMNGDGNMDIILGPRRVHCKDGFKHFGDGICHGACDSESNLKSVSASGYKHYVHPYSGQECMVDPSVPQRDLVVFDWNVENGKQWKFLLSTGNSSYSSANPGFKVHTEELFYCFHETVGQNFMLVDVDSDGLPDLLRNVRGKIYLHLNENGKISQNYNIRSVLQMDNLSAQFAMANVAQSYYWSGGLICVDNENLHVYDYSHNESEQRMLHDLTDSYGVTSNHYYMDIMKVPESRYKGTLSPSFGYISYPHAVMTPHLYVPSWLKKTKGGEQLSWEYYNYTHAVFHCTGLGFRGFRKIETEDVINKRLMTSVFDPELLGAEIKKETPTDTVVRKYVLERAQDKTILLKLQKETVKNALNETEKVTRYEHNGYGQVVAVSTSCGVLKETKSHGYENVENSDLYLLGLPLYSVTKNFRNDSTVIQEVRVDYDDRYWPVCRTNFINGSITSQERYEYNDRLQLIKQKQCSYESTDTLGYTFMYYPNGRLLKKTNAMGLSIDYTYDPATGLLQSSSDAKGRITRYIYDAWGRLMETSYPDGSAKQLSIAWSQGKDPGLYVVTATETGKPVTKMYYDFLKREVRTSQIRFDEREMKIDKVYNPKTGLLEKESLPTKDSVPSHWTHFVYDKFNRLTSTRHASGKIDSCAYGILTDTVLENGIRRIRKYDAAGLMTQVADNGGIIDYYYRPDGQPIVAVVKANQKEIQTRFYYDKYGRRIAIKDPSAGIRRTAYDAAGNICKETDADSREIVKEYDCYGRITRQTTPDMTTVYTYDNTENLLLSAVSSNGSGMYNVYDGYGRLEMQREKAPDGKWLQKTYGYTTTGLPSDVVYTSQNGTLATEHLIYRNGFLSEVRLQDGTLVYRHDEENELGQLTKLTAGGMQRSYTFNDCGLLTRRSIMRADETVMFDHSYSFNTETNSLENRTDETRGLSENFGYDELNRLRIEGHNSIIYDDLGNIRRKSNENNLGLNYTNPNRPYAVTGLDYNGGDPVKSGIDITYTAAQRPSVIMLDTKKVMLTYNANHERIRMQYSVNNQNELTRYYLGGNYEIDESLGSVKEKLYLGGGYYDAPAVLIKEGNRLSVFFIHRDYLGSILQIADAQGNVVEENSFDAWGRLRNPATQTVHAPGTEPELMLDRGFTGHEHLSFFGLINMNARLYDPVLGRFLSPDPYVQVLDFTQSYNRYMYAMNNPLCYVDRNGEFLWFVPVIIGAAIGMYSGGVIANKGQYNPVKWDWSSGKTWGYMLGGAVVGGVSGYVGGAIATSGIPMANTVAIAGSSLVNSVGTWAYTGGQTPISISLGAVSYDFTNGDFGYLGEKGNSVLENIGYGLGALANLSDALIGFNPQKVDLVTENSDAVGHSALVNEGTMTGTGLGNGNPANADPNGIISVGPNRYVDGNGSWHWMKGTNHWDTHTGAGEVFWRQTLNVNKGTIMKYGQWLNKMENSGKFIYSLELSSCVTHTSVALNLSGLFNIGIHPYLLNAQMYLWGNGIRPWTYSYFFNK